MLTQSLILFVNSIKMSIFAYQTIVYEHGETRKWECFINKK